jgi:predicted nucleic acid-binding protein
MQKSMQCVDANLVIQFAVNDENIPVQQQWLHWIDVEESFIAPPLHAYEVLNGIHRYVVRREISVVAANAAWDFATALNIELAYNRVDHDRALQLARRFNRPATYDAHYLALAERLGIEFWTADERLYNSVRYQLPWVHLVGAGAT